MMFSPRNTVRLQKGTRMARISYGAALESAMADEMRRDRHVYTMATSPSAALLAEFGPMRVKRMPISEATMTGIAVGSAGCGYRPVVHWGSVTFAFMAFDQVVNQACKIRYMFGGQRDFPIAFRARYGNGTRSAAQHSQTGYAPYAHLAGLKVVLPSGAADARGLLQSAIRDNNPVVVFEAGRSDPLEEDVDEGDSPVPIGVASVKRHGSESTSSQKVESRRVRRSMSATSTSASPSTTCGLPTAGCPRLAFDSSPSLSARRAGPTRVAG